MSVSPDSRHGHLVGGGRGLADRILLDDRVVVRGWGDDGRYQLASIAASLITNGSLSLLALDVGYVCHGQRPRLQLPLATETDEEEEESAASKHRDEDVYC